MLSKSHVDENATTFKNFVRPFSLNYCLHTLCSLCISPMYIQHHVLHPLLFQAIMNTLGKTIFCSFSSPQKNFCSVFFPHVGSSFPFRPQGVNTQPAGPIQPSTLFYPARHFVSTWWQCRARCPYAWQRWSHLQLCDTCCAAEAGEQWELRP